MSSEFIEGFLGLTDDEDPDLRKSASSGDRQW
jgi:hypothetical protein